MSRAYFVYGTLRPGGRYWRAVRRFVADYEPAWIEGFVLWDLPEGYPCIAPGDGRVFGDLLYIRSGDEEEAQRIMDDIEGLDLSLYERHNINAVRLRRAKQKSVPCATYIYSRTRRDHLYANGRWVAEGEWRPPLDGDEE